MRKMSMSSILAASFAIALFGPLLPAHAVTTTPVPLKQEAISNATSVYGIQLGMNSAQVTKILGNPVRKDPSTTGVEWWIYSKDLNHYMQVGIQNDKVVTLFSNGLQFTLKGIGIGATTDALQKAWGAPKSKLDITPTLTINNNTISHPTYSLNNQIVTFSIDQLGGNKVAGVRISTPEHFSTIAIELMYPIAYKVLPVQPVLTDEQRMQAARAIERENFDLLNIARSRAKLPLLTWDESVAAVARAHSQDMVQKNYFNHVSPKTGSPFDRLKHAGIAFGYAGENIAYGQLDGIEVHMGWMNSAGHRQNLLNPHFKQLGVGVTFKGAQPFYTQNFVSK